MKIRKILLRNFALIYAARQSREVEIDFTKSQNKIVLIQGNNGSGKTSLLSNFHPFSSLGSLDLRNMNHLIIEGEDGYKYIQYEDDDNNIYDIEHHYNHLKDDKWKVSSYIKMNGNELNPSGLVTSFNDIIKQHFGIDYSFLKIIRLGVNVNNLIKLRSAERKDFVSTLLADLDIYNSLFKGVNGKLKKMKMRLRVLTDSINKLNVIDENEFIKSTEELKIRLKEVTEHGVELGANKKFYETELSRDIYNNIEYKIKEDKKILSREKIEKYDNDIFTRIEYSQITANGYATDIEKYQSRLQSVRENISVAEDKVDELTLKINAYNKDNSEKIILEERLKSCKANKEKLLKDINGVIPENLPSKELLEKDFHFLSLIDEISDKILEYPHDSYKVFEKSFMDNLNDLDKTYNDIQGELNELSSKIVIKTSKSIPIPDCNKYKKCEFYNFYKNCIISKSDYTTLFTLYTQAKDICILFKEVNNIMNERQNYENLLPFKLSKSDVFNIILNATRKCLKVTLSDNNVNINCLNTIEIVKKIENIDEEINSITNSLKNINQTMSSVLSVYMDELTYWKSNLSTNVRESYELVSKITEISDKLDSIKSEIKHMEEWVESYDEYEKSLREYNSLKDDYEKFKAYRQKLDKIDNVIEENNSMINYLSDEITKRSVTITSYHNYKDELGGLEKMYNDVTTVQESLSSTKGIPLLFMQLYFKGIQITANNIIKEIYEDKLTLSDFIINDKEFTIPYIVNGVKVKDISSASQGETSIINLALSLAIIENFVTDYNILLLDEIDGALSTKNKQKFFNVLDKQLQKIKARQVFVISHNDLYNTYPCDVILTSKQILPDGVNIIFKPED